MDDHASLIAALSLNDKVLLLTGADSWRTHGARALGLRPIVMSDGPAGARGVTLDERCPSSCLPCRSALGAGREVVQAYLAGQPGNPARPVRTLAAFGIAAAEPGESAEVRLRIPGRAFARWDEALARWVCPPGPFTVQVGRSSRDLRLSLPVRTTYPLGHLAASDQFEPSAPT